MDMNNAGGEKTASVSGLYTQEVLDLTPGVWESEHGARMTISKPSSWGKQGIPARFLPQSYMAQGLGLKVGSISRSSLRKLCGQRQVPGASYLTQNVPIIEVTLNPMNYISREVLGLGRGHHQGIIFLIPSPLLSCTAHSSKGKLLLIGKVWGIGTFTSFQACTGGTLSTWGKTHMPGRRKRWRAGNHKGCLQGKSETDVKNSTEAHWQDCAWAAWSRNTGHVSVGNKNVSVINDALETHSPY